MTISFARQTEFFRERVISFACSHAIPPLRCGRDAKICSRLLKRFGSRHEFMFNNLKLTIMKKIWIVTQESNVDGEITFNAIPCISEETAKEVMEQEIDTILDESPKYKDARRWMEGDDTLNYDECPFVWENENHDSWYLEVINDDYYEYITIEEKEIQY